MIDAQPLPAPPARPNRVPPRSFNTLADEHAAAGAPEVAAVPHAEPPPAGFVDPVEAAIVAATWNRVRRIATVSVLLFPVAVIVAVLVGAIGLPTMCVMLGAFVLLGGTVHEVIAVGLFKFLTLRLWIEAAAIGVLVVALVAGTGSVWEWAVSLSVAVCLVRLFLFSVQLARAGAGRPAVLELREGGE